MGSGGEERQDKKGMTEAGWRKERRSDARGEVTQEESEQMKWKVTVGMTNRRRGRKGRARGGG